MIKEYAEILMEFATSEEIDRTFTYKIPSYLQPSIQVGMRVFVPFGKGNKLQEGYVIRITESSDLNHHKIKTIHSLIDEFIVFNNEMIQLAVYMKQRYGCTLAAALDCMLPPSSKGKAITACQIETKWIALAKSQEETQEHLLKIKDHKRLINQYKVLQFLLEFGDSPIRHVLELLQISESTIRTLYKNNMIMQYITTEEKNNSASNTFFLQQKLSLTKEQAHVVDKLTTALGKGVHETFLLHGVTGSGKTEVFLQLIEEALQKGYQTIVLVPEISLTPQTVKRFQSRFGQQVGITHSRLTPKERTHQWMLAKRGKISVMIGPRSAVFTPFENVKLMIVDEEHENSYKSETTPKYQAKEIAEYRMKQQSGMLVLASATPDLESYYKTQIGEYQLLELTQRVHGRPLPTVDIVDMRIEMSKGNRYVFSNQLYEEIQKTLQRKEQVMLFLNRRGHSTFVSCRNCGYVIKCNHCNITLTYHAQKQFLMCHYCGKSTITPTTCPSCKSPYIRYFGDGTQKVEEESRLLFPGARIARMDIDTMTKKNSHEQMLQAFRNQEIDILIGTQMIAKGHDFPNVTLVGVVAADVSLYMQDFRATERTFQLLTQVTGRAGRGEKLGRVIVQTYNPEHYCIQIASKQDYLQFYNEEIILRKQMGYPPFSHIFCILITGYNENETIMWANRLMEYYNFYNKDGSFELLGPLPATVSKVADMYRWRIIIKSTNRMRLKNYGLYCIAKLKEVDKPSTVQIQSDIDPMMLY